MSVFCPYQCSNLPVKLATYRRHGIGQFPQRHHHWLRLHQRSLDETCGSGGGLLSGLLGDLPSLQVASCQQSFVQGPQTYWKYLPKILTCIVFPWYLQWILFYAGPLICIDSKTEHLNTIHLGMDFPPQSIWFGIHQSFSFPKVLPVSHGHSWSSTFTLFFGEALMPWWRRSLTVDPSAAVWMPTPCWTTSPVSWL